MITLHSFHPKSSKAAVLSALFISAVGSILGNLYYNLPFKVYILVVPVLLFFPLYLFIEQFLRRGLRAQIRDRSIYMYKLDEKIKLELYLDIICSKIQTSQISYFLLVSAHTMFFDIEKPIKDTLFTIFPEERIKKDIRFLLLRRDTPAFKERSEAYIKFPEEGHPPIRPSSSEEYYARCKHIDNELKTHLVDAKVCYYKHPPLFRLLIFDDILFISLYAPNISGHLTGIVQYPKKTCSYYYNHYLDLFSNLFNSSTNEPGEISTSPVKPPDKPKPKMGFGNEDYKTKKVV